MIAGALTAAAGQAKGWRMTIARSLLFRLDLERAHGLTLRAVAVRGRWPGRPVTSARLATRVAGIAYPNPLGLAAGVDKDAVAVPGWYALGLGAVEVGTLTPLPQPGNPRPRLFRLAADAAVINRYGFNNRGFAAAAARLARVRPAGVLGINVGANKDAADRIADYEAGVAAASGVACDHLTINISSPNTPGLRDLQHGSALAELLARCRVAAGTVPLFLKVAPDLDHAEVDAIARAAIAARIDALIVGNTTVSRPALRSAAAGEAGGLSGAPLAPLARATLAMFRAATGDAVPLIAAGGIASGAEAYARIRAGASLCQLYTGLVYGGAGLPRRILRDLDALLARDGFAQVADAVGAG